MTEDEAATQNWDSCGRTGSPDEAVRQETPGDLDPDTWETLCCPDCGSRLLTV